MPWIFSYAELGPQQIEELLGHAPFCSLPASIPNFKITFKGKSRKWASPVATLDRNKGNWVYGSALLVSADEIPKFDRYYQNYLQIEVPVLIDATKDKIKALTYILDKEATPGQPSDDYTKAMLKHLKFFWGQGGNAVLNLENFGIISSAEVPKKEKKSSTPNAAGQIQNIVSEMEQMGGKSTKSRKRAKTE